MIAISEIFKSAAAGRQLTSEEAAFLCQSLDPYLWTRILEGRGQFRAEHVLKAVGTCPVDYTVDEYTITVRTNDLVEVETIRAEVGRLLREPVFQEAFTQALREALPAADEVETVCLHRGANVVSTVRA